METLEFKVKGPLFCPFYNIWGKNVYWRTENFSYNPFTLPASSTSGSPVIIDSEGRFFGFANDNIVERAKFEFNGKSTLTIQIPDGQELISDISGNHDALKNYNERVSSSLPETAEFQRFWGDVEYCSWVEQKRSAQLHGDGIPYKELTETFIVDYLNRVGDMGFPKGKFTIDHGWQNGDETYGDWESDPQRFSKLDKIAGKIDSMGYVPGLWMAPVWLHQDSKVAHIHPEWLGEKVVSPMPDSPCRANWFYFKPQHDIQVHFEKIFKRFYNMGFRKLKFDMMYNNKEYTKQLQKIFYRAVKNINPEIEVEIHHPDIFFTPYCDVVRTNDVLCNSAYAWQDVTLAHFDVCCKCAYGKVINCDHIGGNDPSVDEKTFIEHLNLYKYSIGYPVVSLLPDSIGSEAVAETRKLLDDYGKNRNCIAGKNKNIKSEIV